MEEVKCLTQLFSFLRKKQSNKEIFSTIAFNIFTYYKIKATKIIIIFFYFFDENIQVFKVIAYVENIIILFFQTNEKEEFQNEM